MQTSFFKNGTILSTNTYTTSINKGKATTATINAKKHLCYFCLLHPKGKGSPLLKGLESSFWGQIGVELNSNPLVHNTGVVAASRPHITS